MIVVKLILNMLALKVFNVKCSNFIRLMVMATPRLVSFFELLDTHFHLLFFLGKLITGRDCLQLDL